MKRIIGISFAALLLGFAFATDTVAQSKYGKYSINGRQQNQRQRLVGGVRSGELTYLETYQLGREQAQIHRMETRFRRSGDGLSYREGVRLQHELNQASRHIYKQKHDRQDYPRP
ncbi:MAG: hypothetical protein WKF34_11745 [Pyrinomonadaceae bacterium]